MEREVKSQFFRRRNDVVLAFVDAWVLGYTAKAP